MEVELQSQIPGLDRVISEYSVVSAHCETAVSSQKLTVDRAT